MFSDLNWFSIFRLMFVAAFFQLFSTPRVSWIHAFPLLAPHFGHQGGSLQDSFGRRSFEARRGWVPWSIYPWKAARLTRLHPSQRAGSSRQARLFRAKHWFTTTHASRHGVQARPASADLCCFDFAVLPGLLAGIKNATIQTPNWSRRFPQSERLCKFLQLINRWAD